MNPDDPAHPDAAPGTATERVYDSLYTDILERRLAPGTRLREEELAARFAVSRTVIRQALHRLAQDQVIALNHNRGAQVPAPTRADAAHVFDARRVVECEIARRLAGQLTPAQLGQLHRCLRACRTHAVDGGDHVRRAVEQGAVEVEQHQPREHARAHPGLRAQAR